MKRILVAAAMLASIAVTGQTARAAEFINVLTGGTSGVYYPLGVALSNIYAETIPDVRTQVQSTRASAENLSLLQAGRGEIAFTLGDALALAVAGDAEAGFQRPLDRLRVIAPIYPNYIQIVARADSGIRSLQDLKGKRVSVGAPRSGTELNARAVFAAAGLSYEDFGKVEYLPFGESVELIKNRQLDATLQSAGLGVASIRDLATGTEIVIVPIPEEVVSRIGSAAYVPATVPAGTYDGQDAPVATVAIRNFLVSHDGVSEELAYQMTKQLFENLDRLVAAHNAAKGIDIAHVEGPMPAPLHPGAERYYREVGAIK